MTIVEYLEKNNQTGYQYDEAVDFVNLAELEWNAISCSSVGTTYTCEVSTTDGQFATVKTTQITSF